MNILLLHETDLTAEDRAVIQDSRRISHLLHTLSVTTESSIRAGILNGRRGSAEILQIKTNHIELSLTLSDDPPPPLPLTLVMGMCRPKSFKKALHYATAMGVKEIHVIKTWRVDKSYWSSPVLAPENLHSEAVLALEQCQDTMVPCITVHTLFKPFAQDIFPYLAGQKRAYLAHPYNAQPAPRGIDGQSILVTGPEGGLIQYEVDMFVSYGCKPVTTGPRILRVENAIPALLGRMF